MENILSKKELKEAEKQRKKAEKEKEIRELYMRIHSQVSIPPQIKNLHRPLQRPSISKNAKLIIPRLKITNPPGNPELTEGFGNGRLFVKRENAMRENPNEELEEPGLHKRVKTTANSKESNMEAGTDKDTEKDEDEDDNLYE